MNELILKLLVAIGLMFSGVVFGVAAYVFVSWWETYGREHWHIKHRKELLMKFNEDGLVDKEAFGRMLDQLEKEARDYKDEGRARVFCEVKYLLKGFPLGKMDK